MLTLSDPSARTIPLTKGYVATVDAQDFDMLSESKWWAHVQGRTVYAARTSYDGRRHYLSMHRHIVGLPVGLDIDHINGDTLDNRRANLRVCTHAENLRNQSKAHGSSRFKGVHWHAQRSKWRAEITVSGHSTHLGLYDDEAEAARAYDVAARNLHGEFARLNFSEEQAS